MPDATPQPVRSPSRILPRLASSHFVRELLLMILINFLITVLLVMLGVNRDPFKTLKIANAIGFSIWGVFELLRVIVGERVSNLALARK